jgi:hypothetical protein
MITWPWVAGFLDGDGSIFVKFVKRDDVKRGFSYGACLQFAGSAEEGRLTLIALQQFLECGHLEAQTTRRYPAYKLNLWRHSEILMVLEHVYPHLITKKPHAKLMMSFLTSRVGKPRNEKISPSEAELLNELRRLTVYRANAQRVERMLACGHDSTL